jgi:hypothetical protein
VLESAEVFLEAGVDGEEGLYTEQLGVRSVIGELSSYTQEVRRARKACQCEMDVHPHTHTHTHIHTHHTDTQTERASLWITSEPCV